MWLTPQVMLQLLAQRAAEVSICLAASPMLLGAQALHRAVCWYRSALVVAGEVPTATAQAGGRRRSEPGGTSRRPPHGPREVHNFAAASPRWASGSSPTRNLLDRLTTLWARMEEPT